MRYGSMCSGIGGLDRAVEAVFGATPAWFCESDPHARTVLERHWPGVPVLADLKTQDWSSVDPVDLVCAGYPCQPFSMAGRRAGTGDPRHLWPYVLDAVRVLRPGVVVVENVAGHLGLGFDAVLADLAEAGFDAEWTVVRASDAGACHRRERLFVVAYTDGDTRYVSGSAVEARGGLVAPIAGRAESGGGSAGEYSSPADAVSEPVRVLAGRVGGPPGAGQGERDQRQRIRADHGDGGTGPLADADQPRSQGPQPAGRRDVPARCAGFVADAHSPGGEARDIGQRGGDVGRLQPLDGRNPTTWGDYGPAVRRWEHTLGRAAPAPTDEKGRLSVDFVEWMMGFDAGWVDGLTRTAALRCLGNAVVPQQGALALASLTAEIGQPL